MTQRDTGMTLIELVAAMAVFAVVAVMAVQALSGTLRARDRLADLQQDTATLSRSLSLLRNDLAAAVPLVFFPPDRGAPRSPIRLRENGTRLEISVAGQAALSAAGAIETDALRRVEWRLEAETGTLYRRVWRALTPLNSTAATPEVAVMTGVRALSARSFWPDGVGWRPGVAGQPRSNDTFDGDNVGLSAAFSSRLPDAVELTLRTDAYGDIRLLEAFQ